MMSRNGQILKCARSSACLGLWVSLLLFPIHAIAEPARAAVDVPTNIETRNVPALPRATAARLQRYAETRAAGVVGWQGEQLLITTRFADGSQLHRVSQPLGYREQLTFLQEPLGGVSVPRGGATRRVMLNWDEGGSEFDQLFLFDLDSGDSRMVSDGRSLYGAVMWAPDEQSFVYVTTRRNGRNWDIHWQDLAGNTRALLETDAGYWYPVDWSRDGRHLLVKRRESVNASVLYQLSIDDGSLQPLAGHTATASIGSASYDGHGGVYFTSDAGHEFLRLHHLDLATEKSQVLTDTLQWNVEGLAMAPDYSRLVYVTNEHGRSRLTAWALPERQVVTLPEIPIGVVTGLVFSPDAKKLAVTVNTPTSPSDVYVAHLDERQLVRWTQSEVGGLNTDRFVQPELFSYPSFDGRQIPAFIYRPETPGPHPLVILIHGGPESQYRPYFSTTIQSFVNEMQVAVVAPNVRGSNGYGKSYLRLDNGRLREDSVRDIGALLDWVATEPTLDAARVAVMGGSYGGYMVLAAAVHYGDRLRAAVESVGISNFVTFLENTEAYRQDMRRVEYGDERDPQMRAFLQAISPLTQVERIRTPLLIVQGANDPRVPASESEQIFAALAAAGVPAWYVLARDEGHGFAKKGNRDYDRVARFVFLESHLRDER